MVVSQETAYGPGGIKLCPCGKPRDRKGQRYCKTCHAAYMRDWRAGRAGSGKVQRRVTPEEWAAIEQAREFTAAAPGKVQRRISPDEWSAVQKARALGALDPVGHRRPG